MKGILLAGGNGSRLAPTTKAINKHLIPVYDKPLVYYPLSILMLCNIREILIIVRSQDEKLYRILLGNGENIGCNIEYAIQDNALGIGDAFIIGESFLNNSSVALILGDNVFIEGAIENKILESKESHREGALIFAKEVDKPEQYGVVEFDKFNNVISIEEKPKKPKSNYAVPGLYFYDHAVVSIAKDIKPSGRNELEITDVNIEYLKRNKLKVQKLNCDWFDAGDANKLFLAADAVKIHQERKGRKIACIEEIAFRKNWITKEKFTNLCDSNPKSDYDKYLTKIISS